MSQQQLSRTSNKTKKQEDDQTLLNKIMNDYDSHSDDEVVPLINNNQPSNREIFDSLQKRNDSVFSSTHSEVSAIVTRREEDNTHDDEISYDTYKKVNWKDAILSHFCLRCGLFFTIGLIIGLTIFLSLWFAI
ncbi:predicted protein [Naegleria gruberi]|uniref:Predicted protein n=1 Tax=Naegleria gruberi TaxID=5762 RepID=D2V568_NAEGR|nr:uncharacterized protein NAEGRDRAFT_64032 [Naegleria gruberi]EFC48225.1 predicted protein [Naegleria gruberi]|eukprot:XP_002680969.1 predicted protein [Naegleria gruberi strain NEG-M]